jgi:hypothetical protein
MAAEAWSPLIQNAGIEAESPNSGFDLWWPNDCPHVDCGPPPLDGPKFTTELRPAEDGDGFQLAGTWTECEKLLFRTAWAVLQDNTSTLSPGFFVVRAPTDG